MDAAMARDVAHYSHHQQRDRRGEPMVEHVARVVAAVPPEARAVAWLHDVLEHSPTTTAELRRHGMTGVELDALDLLTRQAGESYELFILRISYAPGAAGRLARLIKLADLDDHLARPWEPGDPPYAWARRHIAVGRARVDYSSSRPSTRARATASERDDASSLR
jgi:hypothetical protein